MPSREDALPSHASPLPVARGNRPYFAAAMSAALIFFLGAIAIHLWLYARQVNREDSARALAYDAARELSRLLEAAATPTYALATRLRPEVARLENFEALGRELIRTTPMLSGVFLAPRGVILQAYPLSGNEKAIGHDLLKDKNRNLEAHQALAKRQLVLAGPFKLLQGGEGIVMRYPVFFNDANGRRQFWGFTAVLVRLDELLGKAELDKLFPPGFRYQLCRTPPKETECQPFAGDVALPAGEKVSFPVQVHHATWTLNVVAEDDLSPTRQAGLWGLAFLLALLGGGVQYLTLQRRLWA